MKKSDFSTPKVGLFDVKSPIYYPEKSDFFDKNLKFRNEKIKFCNEKVKELCGNGNKKNGMISLLLEIIPFFYLG